MPDLTRDEVERYLRFTKRGIPILDRAKILQLAGSWLTLEITHIRLERLQDISEEDARSEGVRFTDFGDDYGYMKQQKPGFHVGEVSSYEECHSTAKTCFGGLWETIHAKDGMGWEKNPWVWVIQFRVVQKP